MSDKKQDPKWKEKKQEIMAKITNCKGCQRRREKIKKTVEAAREITVKIGKGGKSGEGK